MNRTLKDDLELARNAARSAIAEKYDREGASNTANNIRAGLYDDANSKMGQSPELKAAYAGAEATVRAMWRAELLVYVREACKNGSSNGFAADIAAATDAELADDLYEKDSDVADWVDSYDMGGNNGMTVLTGVIKELRRERLIP